MLSCVFTRELCPWTRFSQAEFLVLAGVAISPAPALPASTGISARLKRAQEHISTLNVLYGAGSSVCASHAHVSQGKATARRWCYADPSICADVRPGVVWRVLAKTVFPWVSNRASMLYLAARTHSRAAVCLPAANIAALREFWTDWLPWTRKHRSF